MDGPVSTLESAAHGLNHKRTNSLKKAYRFVFGHKQSKSKDLSAVERKGVTERSTDATNTRAVSRASKVPIADGLIESSVSQHDSGGTIGQRPQSPKPAQTSGSPTDPETEQHNGSETIVEKDERLAELESHVKTLEAEYAAKEKALEERRSKLEEIIAADVVEKIDEAKKVEREAVEEKLKATHQEELDRVKQEYGEKLVVSDGAAPDASREAVLNGDNVEDSPAKAELDEARAELQTIKDELKAAKEALESLQVSSQAANAENAELSSQNASLVSQVESLTMERGSLKVQHQDALLKLEQGSRELEASQKFKTDLQAKADALALEFQSINEELESKRLEVTSHADKLQSLEQDHARAQITLNDVRKELEETKKRSAEKEAEIEQLTSTHADAVRAIEESNQNEISGWTTKHGKIDARLAEVTGDLNSTREELANANTKAGSLASDLETAIKSDDAAKAALETAQADIAKLNETIASNSVNGEASSEQLLCAKEALSKVEAELSQVTAIHATAKSDLEAANVKISELETNHTSATAELATVKDKLERLTKDYEQAQTIHQTNLSEETTRHASTKVELETANEKLGTLNGDLESHLAINTRLQATLDQIKSEAQGHAAVESDLKAARSQIESLKSEIEAGSASLANITEQLSQSAAALGEAQKAHAEAQGELEKNTAQLQTLLKERDDATAEFKKLKEAADLVDQLRSQLAEQSTGVEATKLRIKELEDALEKEKEGGKDGLPLGEAAAVAGAGALGTVGAGAVAKSATDNTEDEEPAGSATPGNKEVDAPSPGQQAEPGVDESVEAQTPQGSQEHKHGVEDSAVAEPTAEEPAVGEPAAEEPSATEEPSTAEEPSAKGPTPAVEPATEEPTVEEPSAAVESVATEEPAAVEEPVAVEEPPTVVEPSGTEQPSGTEKTATASAEDKIAETQPSSAVQGESMRADDETLASNHPLEADIVTEDDNLLDGPPDHSQSNGAVPDPALETDIDHTSDPGLIVVDGAKAETAPVNGQESKLPPKEVDSKDTELVTVVTEIIPADISGEESGEGSPGRKQVRFAEGNIVEGVTGNVPGPEGEAEKGDALDTIENGHEGSADRLDGPVSEREDKQVDEPQAPQ
ncbi:hypothetical protein P152DRAFT_445546 [Eremomyces bilateralis CBS 781.70]|uniref:Uncharacterized protein n=1 Tax=Eremomyces bilateralis CBS 781.70 TaxID=1392243 RepID=A0A6G1GH87_9PEZI|nr:uncharacterized protein P152DRAFT_445546 [Eremomyces bilateralis CBS 781.70]KAF1817465.1 hypothetical protein P152DRAFT_445546 [Eremomyces bilateralis CBS 781.70]